MTEMTETVSVDTPEKSNSKLRAVLIIGGVALFVVGTSVGIYFLLKKKRAGESNLGERSRNNLENSSEKTKGLPTNKTSRSPGFVCNNKAYPLKYGTCHPDVGILQQYLKKMYQADLGRGGAGKDGVDKKFGAATKNAAIKYLNKAVFTSKDIVGIKTALKFIPV